MKLSLKQKIFEEFFSKHFEHFEKKDDPHSSFISKLTDSEKRGYINL